MNNEKTPTAYALGRQARDEGDPITACAIPTTRFEARSWWLAGYIDADIEQGNNKYFGAAQ